MLSVRAFSRSNPVALLSYCDPSLVAALLELLPEGSQVAPHIGALSAPARSSVGRSRALPLDSQAHDITRHRLTGKVFRFFLLLLRSCWTLESAVSFFFLRLNLVCVNPL
jgi:hypothetical protein